MGIGTSIFLIAVGAILKFAVDVRTEGINLDAVGVVLDVVGALGALLSMLFWTSWGGPGGRRRSVVVDDSPVVTRRDDVIV